MGVLVIPGKPLISAKEAVEISKHNGGITTVIAAKEVADEWEPYYSDATHDYYCMLAAVYTAGYIQGKREERAKKKKGA